MASVSAFYADSEGVLARKIDAKITEADASQVADTFEINRSIQWITNGQFKRVALQFPDELMSNAVSVYKHIADGLPDGSKVFILGDTSYGSCCVDEVAAQHYNADAIIHYGRSCLSKPSKMPVLFVFGRLPLNIDDCVHKFTVLFPDTKSNVVIMYDTVYEYASCELLRHLRESYLNVHMSQLSQNHNIPVDDPATNMLTIQKCGRMFHIPKDEDVSKYSILYIGSESLTLTNLMYSFQSCTFYTYNPANQEAEKERVNINKMLMKRYYKIEKAKDARIVGILVGTLGVANYMEILNRLKSLIKKAGKKTYVFIVGKINVAKLANFMEVDVFVLIACAENSLLDSSEFYKPVVTPFEMEVACNTDREWTGDYPTDFTQLLPGGSQHVPIPDEIQEDAPHISLITGQIMASRRDDSVQTGSSVVLRSDTLTVATQADTAGEYLSQRSWQGLQQKLGETPVTKAVEGQKGIAMQYHQEPH